MTGSGQEALPDFGKWLGGPPGRPGVVVKPSRMTGSGREALPDVQEWSGGPPGCPGVVRRQSWVVGRPTRMSRSGREASRLDVRQAQMSGSGQEALPDV